MAVYRFRITFSEYDEVFRDIDIRSTQTFEELHHALVKAVKFDGKHSATFMLSDDQWRSGQEVALVTPSAKKQVITKISAHINNPRQKFLYVYDPDSANWEFMVELIKIHEEQPKANYPVCVKIQEEAPRQYKLSAAVPLEDEDEEEDMPDSIFESKEDYSRGGEDEDDEMTGMHEEDEDGEELSDEDEGEQENDEYIEEEE